LTDTEVLDIAKKEASKIKQQLENTRDSPISDQPNVAGEIQQHFEEGQAKLNEKLASKPVPSWIETLAK
jgi:hypothetical protein